MMFRSSMRKHLGNAAGYLMTLGVVLILFGLLLIAMPELLAYLISFFFIFAGVLVLSWAWRIKIVEKKVKSRVEEVTDSIKSGVHTVRDHFDKF